MRRNKRKSRNEVRHNYSTGHYNFIFEEEGNKYHALGLTTSSFTRDKKKKWHKNMPLTKNPKKNDTRKSYIRYGYISQNKNTFGKVDKRFSFSDIDKPKVKSKIRYYKNKRRNK